ncbi:MAG: hypothetical protein IJJ50_05025 [Lachnospiraceae bacterium]|nr:hypothetical protein [Lachnospiraceae bacterium]
MILYAKFSNERSPKFAIRTMIAEENGVRTVLKTAASEAGLAHVQHFSGHYEKLTELYRKAGFVPNRVALHGDTAVFEYIEGKLFETTLLAFADKTAAFEHMWKSFFERIDQTADTSFSMMDAFSEVFGNAEALVGGKASSCADIDLIPSNILEEGGVFHVIDYEWTFDFPVPVDFIKWRAVVYFAQKLPKDAAVTEEMLLEMIPADERKQAVFRKMEESFQNYMLGKHVPLRLLYPEMTPGSIDMTHLEQWTAAHQTVTVYLDRGEGFSEADVMRFPVDNDGFAKIRVPLSGIQSFRIDPTEQPCIVRIGDEAFVRDPGNGSGPDEETQKLLKTVTINGWRLREGKYAFPDPDPWLHVTSRPEGTDVLSLDLHIENMPCETADILGDLLASRSFKARAKQLLKGKKT